MDCTTGCTGLRAAAPPRETSREAVLQNFKSKLDLSAEQTDQIAVVLQDYSHYYESLQDQLDDLRSTGLSRIVQILQPGQREKFEKMRTELAPQLSGRTQKTAAGAGDLVTCRILGT